MGGDASKIDDCKNINDLIKVVEYYTKLSNQEKGEIEAFVTDKVPMKNIKKEDFQDETDMMNRAKYLDIYLENLDKTSKILNENKKLDFEQTKGQIGALVQCYKLKEDTEGNLKKINDNLQILNNLSKKQ